MFKSVLGRHSWWRGLTTSRIMGSPYKPLVESPPTASRSKSLPTSNFQIAIPSSFRNLTNHNPQMDEVDAACPNVSSDYDTNSFNGGKRKLGIFLTGAAAGSVAAGLWTYSDLKNEPDLPMMEEGRPLGLLQAAQVINDLSDEGKPSTPTRRERFNFIADVVAETGPVLVYIEIKDLRVRDYFTGQPTTASNGSGFVVQKDGLILTNAHVVAGKPRAAIQVRLQDGRTFIGTVEDIDMKSDLATVRIPCKNLPVMKLGKSSNLRPGEFVIAMGSPLALSNTITTGVVSSVARNKKELGISRGRDVPDYIQTDAAITFGNSGGPLINLDGEAIGINSLKITPGISFAIPIDYAKEFLQKSEQRRRSGWPDQQIQRRYMGITMLAISPQIIEELRSKIDIPPHIVHGIVVFRIVQGSPADRAGLQPGDIITHINGIAIHKSGDVYELLESTEDLHVTLSRKNSTIQYIVKPED